MRIPPLLQILPFLFLCLPGTVAAQEARQFRVILSSITDPKIQGGSGSLILFDHSLTYQIGTPGFGGVSLHGPGIVTSNAPTIFPLALAVCEADGGCGDFGEITLADQQIEYLKNGLMYVDFSDTFRGQVVPSCVSQFRPDYEITFPLLFEGRNPTNRTPRILRWGRGTAGFTGNLFSYELRMPTAYAPYTLSLHRSLSPRRGGIAVLLGNPPYDSTGIVRPVDAVDLENLPSGLVRGSFCVDDALKEGLLTGAWWLRLTSPYGFEANASLIPADTDQDGVPDYRDDCPQTPPGSVINEHGCSIDQLAPCLGPWRNHGDYVNRVKSVSEDFQKAGLITAEQRRGILNFAAQSSCGQR